MTLSAGELEELAIQIYSACFDQYDRHKPVFNPCRDAHAAWAQIHESQRNMCRDQARRAAMWMIGKGFRR
jgi:hypothetical protein